MAGWWAWSEEAEQSSIPSYAAFVGPGDLVFDIGANRGRKVWIFRQLGARVVAVEPLFAFGPEFVPEFYWKFGRDRMVMPIDRAVTPERDVVISVNRFMPWCSSISRPWMTESAHAAKHGEPYYRPGSLVERRVRGITLDALINIYGIPRFIKVDVEGSEDQAVGTLTTPVPGLNMEFHADWIPVRALEHMDGLGAYEWNYCLDNRGSFVLPEWVCRGKLLEALRANLTRKGKGSWGDIYGRLVA